MAYTRIPKDNAQRNPNAFRSTVDNGIRFLAQLKSENDKILQMTDAEVAAEYGLTTEQEGNELKSLTNSTFTELDTAPFFAQWRTKYA